jgi:hypothetical protein
MLRNFHVSSPLTVTDSVPTFRSTVNRLLTRFAEAGEGKQEVSMVHFIAAEGDFG